jgi:NTP pyrophosphatase (non-canonical NTP hydrolase)
MSITWTEYQQQALITAIYPVDREVDYTIDGLGSEIGELGEKYLEAKLSYYGISKEGALDECGDILWYAAAVADALNTPLGHIMEGPAPVGVLVGYSKGLTYVSMTVSHGKMLGIIKKSIRDNDGFLADAHREALKVELHKIIWHTMMFIEALGGSLQGVMAKNLNKLADRKNRGVLQGSGDHR